MQQPHISHQFTSAVWRLEIDAASNTIFAEIREPSDKQVSFTSIDLVTGKVNFEALQTEERWLIGIEAAHDGVLLLHQYQSETGPAHRGLVAIDGATGKSLWSNYTHAFDHLSRSGPVIFDTRLQPPNLLVADIHTGATKSAYQPTVDLEIDNQVVLPQILPAEFLPSLSLQLNSFGDVVHYIDYNDFRIVSLHALADGALQQLLYILTAGNKIIFQDLLNKNIQKLQPESFLLREGQLIYLTEQSRLKVINLDTF